MNLFSEILGKLIKYGNCQVCLPYDETFKDALFYYDINVDYYGNLEISSKMQEFDKPLNELDHDIAKMTNEKTINVYKGMKLSVGVALLFQYAIRSYQNIVICNKEKNKQNDLIYKATNELFHYIKKMCEGIIKLNQNNNLSHYYDNSETGRIITLLSFTSLYDGSSENLHHKRIINECEILFNQANTLINKYKENKLNRSI